MKDTQCILILNSVYDIMKAEKAILQQNMKVDIIPTPRELSHDCGVVIRFRCELLDEIKTIILKSGFETVRFFRKNPNGAVEMIE